MRELALIDSIALDDVFSHLGDCARLLVCLINIFQKINYKWSLGILETIFDGIQRPLKTIAELSQSVFVPRGVDLPCLDQDRLY